MGRLVVLPAARGWAEPACRAPQYAQKASCWVTWRPHCVQKGICYLRLRYPGQISSQITGDSGKWGFPCAPRVSLTACGWYLVLRKRWFGKPYPDLYPRREVNQRVAPGFGEPGRLHEGILQTQHTPRV